MSETRILVVEDNPADVLLLKEALAQHHISYSLEHYGNGEAALQAFATMQAPPDLILLDLNIPRINGFEVLKSIRSHPVLSKAKVAVFTSSPAAHDKMRCQQLGADAYVVKPPGYDQFVADVGRAIVNLLSGRAANPGASGRCTYACRKARSRSGRRPIAPSTARPSGRRTRRTRIVR